MTAEEWKNYKKYNLHHIWKVSNISWISKIANFPLINFLKKLSLEHIHYNWVKLRFKITKKPIIPILEYIVTTRCTLSCKNCNTCIPYFTNKTHTKIITFEKFKQDLDILLEAVDYINVFGLLGGEPLLAKELPQMIKYALSKKQIHNVFIASNATILPTEELLSAMKHKKFTLQLSNYSKVENIKGGMKVQYAEFRKLLSARGIKFHDIHENSADCGWQTIPKIYKDKQEESLMCKQYATCYGQYCTMLLEGKIIQCCTAVYTERNIELTDEVKKEIINIRECNNSKLLANKIINFYAKPYSQFCHYCHFVDIEYGLPCGEQVE